MFKLSRFEPIIVFKTCQFSYRVLLFILLEIFGVFLAVFLYKKKVLLNIEKMVGDKKVSMVMVTLKFRVSKVLRSKYLQIKLCAQKFFWCAKKLVETLFIFLNQLNTFVITFIKIQYLNF